MSAFFKLSKSQSEELFLHPDHKITFVPVGSFVFPVMNVCVYSGETSIDYYVGKTLLQVSKMLKVHQDSIRNGFGVNN